MHKQKQQDKDEIQIHKFWQMFKQLHINITLANALILIPKYQKMIKALFSNKEKLLELEDTPLNENFSAVILKKLPEKLEDSRKFLIPCGFSELKVPLILGRPFLQTARALINVHGEEMILRDADFVIVDYESDPRVPFILGRPFLRTARSLIDVHGEKMIHRDGDERLTLNMRHVTSSYSNQPQKELINLINVFNNSSEDFLKDLFSTNQPSGNPTFSSHPELTSSKVKYDTFDPEGGNVLPEKLLDLDSTKDLHPPLHVKAVEEFVLPVEVLTRTTSVLSPVATLSQSTGITFKDMVKNELRNEMKTSIQTSLSNQTNEIKNMMASLLQMNTASTSWSGTLPGNTIANPKGELKAITTQSGLVTEGPTVPNPPKPVNLEEDECVEETYTDPDHAEYNIKQEKDDIQIQKFWNMFKQLHLNITLAEALVLMPKYQKMLKALLSNKEKLQELANTPLNENCSTMTLELANRAICTPDGIARDVFVPVGKFTFTADFVVVDYESDPRVPIILGRPFLRTAHALIEVHDEEMILHDGDKRLTLNMKHDTASYSNHPYRESIHDSKRCTFLSEELPDIDSFNDIHPHFDDDPLSGSTTYSANSLLEEFTDEFALISYPPDYDDYRACDIESDIKEIECLLFQGKDSDFKDSIDQSVLTHLDDLFVPIPSYSL
nr:hypothetical protein [Tanacetum cinerariifolium]